ncbi:MAG: hypothetical protein EOP48_06780 [Sphingobacteriales bacterium]|nr:MAG: hypothetical protein EOP48_06780 [Sphingobacteriales bacterium]
MVTVTNYKVKHAKDGRNFTLLELQGGLEMVQSNQTGRFYATVRKCTVSTTFDEMIAKTLIGTQMPGKITRVECDPYEYTVESTGEVIMLAHRWGFWPENSKAPMSEVID